MGLSTSAQEFGILFQDGDSSCKGFNQVFANKPKEVYFQTIRKGDKLYLRVTDEQWLKSLMQNQFDGIAVDIIDRDLYNCNAVLPATQIKGQLLKPVYKSALLKGLEKEGIDAWITEVGIIPASLRNKSLEFNTLFLSNKTLCQYYNIYNLNSYPWDLLDMGIYLDKVTYKETKIIPEQEVVKNLSKTFNFVIPFEKNKSQYSALDVKPIYDSLDLTDYKISKIKIKAYASVEGSTATNKKLQEDRGNSIITSLKSYLKETIETEVTTSENWAEFFNDIQNTSSASLGKLSKEEIKGKLVGATAQELEPILSNHRKGIVSIELTKIERYKEQSDAQLITSFNTSLKAGDLENATILQKAIFDRYLKSSDPSYLDKMEIPAQITYADFNNNRAVFGYYKDQSYALIAKNKLLNVLEVAPQNKKVRYNIAAINIYLLRANFGDITEKDVRNELIALKKYGINNVLIERMFLNLNIIIAEKYKAEKKYKEKDNTVKNIKSAYKNIPLSDSDYLSLAQFLTYYDNSQSAANLLKPLMSNVSVNEDLLYYYINLTIVQNTYVAQDDYRAVLSNAYSQNPKRFCKLFTASTEDGVTFQLLHNEYLRRSYCDSCN